MTSKIDQLLDEMLANRANRSVSVYASDKTYALLDEIGELRVVTRYQKTEIGKLRSRADTLVFLLSEVRFKLKAAQQTGYLNSQWEPLLERIERVLGPMSDG